MRAHYFTPFAQKWSADFNMYESLPCARLFCEFLIELSASDLRSPWGNLCHVCTGLQQLGAEIYKEIPLFDNIIPPIV